jgi:hypothetical protein
MHSNFREGSEQTNKKTATTNYLSPVSKSNSEKNDADDDKAKEVWLNTQQVLQRLPISERLLQTWRTKGMIPYTKIGGKILYPRSGVDLMLMKNMK